MSYRVTGASAIRDLSRDLKAAGSNLRKAIPKGMRKAARPLVRDIRAEARSSLPQRGGLAGYVASSGIRVSTTAGGVTVVGKRSKGGGLSDLEAINAGTVRHPTYGRRPWAAQGVRAGFWDRPVERNEPAVVREMNGVIDEIRRKFEGG
jgi:hypothetical protein